MTTTRPSTRAERRAKKPATLPGWFQPRFIEDCDQRQKIVRTIRERYESLRGDVAADNTQKDLLVRRAVFMSIQLETMEITAAEGGDFDAGIYTQMCNALKGYLKDLGLETKADETVTLRSIINGNGKR